MARKELATLPNLEALKASAPPAEITADQISDQPAEAPITTGGEAAELTLHVPRRLMRALRARAEREGIRPEQLVMRWLAAAEYAQGFRAPRRPNIQVRLLKSLLATSLLMRMW
jgi:hypothetical protein